MNSMKAKGETQLGVQYMTQYQTPIRIYSPWNILVNK